MQRTKKNGGMLGETWERIERIESRRDRKEMRWELSKERGQQMKGKRMEMNEEMNRQRVERITNGMSRWNGRSQDEQGKEGAMLGWGWGHTLTLCTADTV